MVKSLRDIIGYKRYKELSSDKSGKQLIDLLQSYGRISRHLASDDLINTVHEFIKSRIGLAYKFYMEAAQDDDEHLSVAEKLYDLHKDFFKAKTRLDKVINIDAFMHTAHLSGSNVIARLWKYPDQASLDEITPTLWLKYLADISVRENPKKKNDSPFIEPGTISKSERRDWQRKRNIKIKTGTGAKW